MNQRKTCLSSGKSRIIPKLAVGLRLGVAWLLVLASPGCVAPQPNQSQRNFAEDYDRLSRVEVLLNRSDEALATEDIPTAMGCLRQACGLSPGDKRIHWKMAVAAEMAGERQVGYRALKVLVTLDPSLEENAEVLALAERLASLKKRSRFSLTRNNSITKPEFSWSEYYKPQNPANITELPADANSKIMTHPQVEEGHPPLSELTPKRIGKLWGFVDAGGKLAINPQFDKAEPFSEGFASVCLAKRWGFIDKSGKFVINPQFDDVGYFSNGSATVKLNGHIGHIDKSGTFKLSNKP